MYAQSNIDEKVKALLQKMTLEEKVGQMNQYSGFWDATGPAPQEGAAARKYEHLRKGWVGSMLNVHGVDNVRRVQEIAVEESRLGIPLIIGFDVIHGYKTISPIPLAEAASWDMEAIQRSAAMAAEEAAAAGINWTFAPMVDISRDARWGRVMEGGGEDPFLGSKIAAARVNGFQGDDLSAPNTLAACAKHLAGYGFAEAGRDYNTVDIGASTLYNVVFPPFIAAKEAGVRTFMNAFNILNGIPATGDTYLQREVLKGAWAFDGFVVSDWGSVGEMVDHGFVRDEAQAARQAVTAGSDMDMESYAYVNHLADLVRSGKVDEALVDDAVRRILRVKFELGLFADPYRYCDPERETRVIGSESVRKAALDMARKSIVLLKNENDLLPLPTQGQKIALIGALSADKTSPLGSWRLAGEDSTALSVLEGMQAYEGNELVHQPGPPLVVGETSFVLELTTNTTDTSGIAAAVAAAKDADVAVLVLGEHGFHSGEARSRTDLGLPGVQQQLLEAVYAVNPNIVLVLQNGRPLALPWAAEHVPAIVEAWQLGTMSGKAIAEVLYGDYNPAGKLPVTFPRSVGQVPLYYNQMSTGRPAAKNPGEVFYSHYIDESNDPLFVFGHGLSYTTFAYDNLRLSTESVEMGEPLTVSVDLTNTGTRPGTEVVQLYLHDRYASVVRPIKELKGFERVGLQPGETITVTFTIDQELLGFYNTKGEWTVEPGWFDVMVGGSSDTQLNGAFRLKKQASYQLVWADEFDQSELDRSVWNIALGDGCPKRCGWGNNERQIYTRTNHRLENGKLIITARKEGKGYTSTRINTKGKKAFQYGRFEMRAKLPVGTGVWPAFWMLGSNIDEVDWPLCGEIDILEYAGKEPGIIHTSLHTADSHGNTINTRKTKFYGIEEGFHTYAAEWTEEAIRFFIDDQLVYTFSPDEKTEEVWPYDQPFYLLLNLAIGGGFGGPIVDDTILPQEYSIDYVRVYQRE